MGLFDMFKTQGQLSNSANPAVPDQYVVDSSGRLINNPAYAQFVDEQISPKNMDTGRKLMMLGNALRGQDVSASIDEYQSGIRERFDNRAKNRMNMATSAAGLAKSQQAYNQNEIMNPLRVDAQTEANTAASMANTQNAIMNPLRVDAQTEANTAASMANAQNTLMNPLRVDAQTLANTGAAQNNAQDAAMNPLLQSAQSLANQQAGQNLARDGIKQDQYYGDKTNGFVGRFDPASGQIVDVTDQYTEAQLKAFRAGQAGTENPKNYNSALGRVLSEAELAADKAYGKNLANENSVSASGNIATLDMIANGLESQDPTDGSTGLSWMSPFTSAARLLDRDGDMGIRPLLDAQGLDTQEIVAGVIQKNLRETLGAQFTQREGQLLIQRAYNPNLSPQMNARRLKAISYYASQVLAVKQAKADHYRKYGTLANYDPSIEAKLDEIRAQTVQIYNENGGFGDISATSGAGDAAGAGQTSTGVTYSLTPVQ